MAIAKPVSKPIASTVAAPPIARTSPTGIKWESAPTSLMRHCVFMEIYGDTGSGRTTLALTAPGPIAFIHAAEKIDGIIQPAARLGKIGGIVNFGGSFRGTDADISAQAMKVWKDLELAWADALKWARTIVLDTHTEAWELIRLAYFGDLKPASGRVESNWGPVNARWRSMFKSFRMQDSCNVVIIGQTKEEYTKGAKTAAGKEGMGQRTGRTIRAGQKEIDFMADVILRTSRGKDGSFISTVEKGWFNADSEGLEFQDTMSEFNTVMNIITMEDSERWG